MTAAVTFFVPGRPYPKKRARSGQGRMYTPAETVEAERAIRFYARRVWSGEPIAGPVLLECRFVFERAKNSRLVEPHWHTIRIDLDNALKLVSDALNPVPRENWAGCWRDDSQVARVVAEKTWATGADPEGSTVTVSAL